MSICMFKYSIYISNKRINFTHLRKNKQKTKQTKTKQTKTKQKYGKDGRKMIYLTMHIPHFIYGYMTSDMVNKVKFVLFNDATGTH